MSKFSRLQVILHKRQFSTNTILRAKEKHNNFALESIFSDINRQRVESKLESSHPLPRPDRQHKVEREAGVLVPFCHIDGEPSILFMMRSKHLNSHSGEVCFPGGMMDPEDADLTTTALRETYEEIGLPARHVDVWGSLPASPSSMRGRWATPVLGYCKNLDLTRLKLNEHEVELVFTRTIASLCDPANTRQTQMRYKDTNGYTIPAYIGGEHRIWGLTGIILHQVLTLIAPGLYTFKIRHRS